MSLLPPLINYDIYLVVWIAAALEAAYANWPEEGVFIIPEIEVMLTIEEV